MTKAATVFAVSLIALLLVLAPVLDSGLYVIDDDEIISSLPKGGFTPDNIKQVIHADKSVFLPLTGLTYLLDQTLGGDEPARVYWFMHLSNLVYLSLACTCLFFLLPTGMPFIWGLLGVLLFALHPLHVFPTAWIASRKDVLVCLFMLLTVLLYRKGKQPFALMAFLAALLCKLSAYGLFFWIVCFEIVRMRLHDRQSLRRVVRQIGIFLIPVILIVPAFTSKSSHVGEIVNVTDKSLSLIGFYLLKVIWPWPIVQYYTPPAGLSPLLNVLLAAVVVAIFSIFLLRSRRSAAMAEIFENGVLGVAFLIPYVVVMPIHLIVNNAYAYSLVAAVVMIIFHRVPRYVSGILLVVILGVFARYSYGLAVEFTNPVATFERNMAVYPDDLSAYLRFGEIAEIHGEIDKSLQAYDKAIDIHIQRTQRIPITAYEAMLGVALRHRQKSALERLSQLAAANTQPYYCLEIQRGLAEFTIHDESILQACRKRFPKDLNFIAPR